MSGTTVTNTMRELAWNVEFTIGQEEDPTPFAGIYQVPDSDLVTFRNVCDELRLCFEFPSNVAREEISNNTNEQTSIDTDDPLASVAFALTKPLDLQEVQGLSFVTGDLLDKPVPTLPPLPDFKQRNVLIYHLVSHKACELPADSPLNTHFEKGCAREFFEPVRRFNPRYLPPNETHPDPALGYMPLRERKQPGSPNSQSLDNANDAELDDMLAPRDIEYDEAKRYSTEFRSSCLRRGTCCVVSGEGAVWWCPGSPVGPGVEACHIVPQIHYYLYPSGRSDDDFIALTQHKYRLRKAWENTWNPRKNGILLMKHLHTFFDARLFSIHPETLRIRVFAPYDALVRFNGQKALVPLEIDRKALRYHYEMSCIENIGAASPCLSTCLYTTSPSISRRPGNGPEIDSTLRPKTDFLPTPDLEDMGNTGSPSKRPRPASPRPSQPGDASRQHNLEEADAALWTGEAEYKRRRLEERHINDQNSPQWYQEDMQDSYITPGNSREFLADVN
ncbi:hypothetical protein O1611_g1954 [Lasiodiplodia mahajangana]|uniref:Uncharacterized protein n=1 Tax=Lasiodiplodia mahajangana TaxID=1108764 RepID=A0ACC2JW86_9PEZI|nr:hypothetical protein O1611_g1954 [Lasiodiplodia mahajangana]